MSPNAGFSDVSSAIEERAAVKLFWNNGTELDQQAEQKIRSLLKGKLNVEHALQVALLNNRDLQATYSELGIAQADLVQAGLLSNPVFDAAVLFPVAGGASPDLELSLVMNFLDVLYMPLRKRVAAARFEETKLRVTGAVLDFAAQVRTAFYTHQANEQMLDLRQTIVQALTASFEVARRLHEAGNITDLDYARERAQAESAKVTLRAAEVAARQSREALNTLMGLWGRETEWEVEGSMPDVPAEPLQTDNLESRALRSSVDIAHARQRIIVAGEQLGFRRFTALIPEFHSGPLGEREGGEWEVGPTLEFPLPLFDRGRARIGAAAAELRRAQQEYYATAVKIRSAARAARDRMEGVRDRALYYRDILLPLQERIVNEAQLQYNAMQLGPFQLLRAKEQQIETAIAYIETLREYWLAQGDLRQIFSGRLPLSNGRPMGGSGGQMRMNDREGH
ncbi:MAG: TolC family protein [Candidatus Binatia bacterium]